MSTPVPDQLLEEEIRAMLQRRAQDVNPEPPPWRELAQRNGAIVISLRTGAPVDTNADRRRRRPGRQWFRGVLAAAVALIVAMVGALLVQGSGPDHGDSANGPEPIDVPAAGNTDFNPARATPLFPVTNDASPDLPSSDWLSDPTETARQYLGSVGLPAGKPWLLLDEAVKTSTPADDGEPPIQTANVYWSLHPENTPELPTLTDGVVFLRNTESGARDTWLVVGVMTINLKLVDVRRDGDELSFTVDRTVDDSGLPQPAAITVDDEKVGAISIGETKQIRVQRPAGKVAVIQVQHMVDGVPWSVTSTAVPAVPGAPVEPADAVPEPTTVPAGRADVVAAQLERLVDRLAVIEARSAPVPTVLGAAEARVVVSRR